MRLPLLLFLAATLSAQTSVDVQVVDSLTGAPISGAYVGDAGMAGDPALITDSAGHFRITSHGPDFYVTVKRNGYLAGFQNLTIQPGQPAKELRIQLVPQAVISGHVFDENGLPVRGAFVSTLQYREVNGQRRLQLWRGSVVTNELGEYRISELAAGRYYLGITPEKLAEWNPRYTSRLYPDETEVDRAEVFEVHAGEERSGRDFRLTPFEGVTVSGRLVLPGKAGISYLFLESTEYPDYYLSATLSGTSFTITHVPPGNYRLRNWRAPLQLRLGHLMGDLPLQVGKADIHDINLEIRPMEARTITGTVTYLGHTKPDAVSITLRRELGETKSVVSNADGSFVLEGVLPGRHLLDVRRTTGDGTFVAAQLGTQDVTSQSLDIGTGPTGELKISMAGIEAEVNGRLLDAAGRPVSGASILFLSRAENIDSYGYTKEDGSFTANFRTTGEHRIFVLTSPDERESLRDPLFLQAHENDFAPVRISEGANAPLILRDLTQAIHAAARCAARDRARIARRLRRLTWDRGGLPRSPRPQVRPSASDCPSRT